MEHAGYSELTVWILHIFVLFPFISHSQQVISSYQESSTSLAPQEEDK